MAAEENMIGEIVSDLVRLRKELQTEEKKQRRKPEEVDKTGILKQEYDLRLLQLKGIDTNEFKNTLEKLPYNTLNNFYIILKDCPFLMALVALTKQELNARRIEAAKPKVPSQKRLAKKAKEAKAKEAMLSPEDIVFKFLQINHIMEVTLGEEKLVINPENEHSILLAVNAIIQYFG
ncbi:MAG: hypothetical protein K2Q33_02350, partial [Gammaproteobacteria bacterium]|nr:hypothetical protein [Gammaproteobacteria bacterium]